MESLYCVVGNKYFYSLFYSILESTLEDRITLTLPWRQDYLEFTLEDRITFSLPWKTGLPLVNPGR